LTKPIYIFRLAIFLVKNNEVVYRCLPLSVFMETPSPAASVSFTIRPSSFLVQGCGQMQDVDLTERQKNMTWKCIYKKTKVMKISLWRKGEGVIDITIDGEGERKFPGQFPTDNSPDNSPPGQFPLPTRTIPPPVPLETELENYIHTCLHTCIHKYIHAYTHRCMHTHIYAYNTYMHKNIHIFRHTDTLIYSHIHGVSEKSLQNCFCQNFVKFPSIAIIFGRYMAKWLKYYGIYTFST